jgi:hypothetical protein
MNKPKRVALVAADYPELELYCPNFVGMQNGLRTLGIPFKFISARPTLDINEIIDYKPDLVVYCLMEILYNEMWVHDIRVKLPNAKIVFWYGDYRNKETGYFEGNFKNYIDAMFVSNDAQSDFWKEALKIPEVYYLPLGCTPIKEKRYNSKFDLPFVFIGCINTGRGFKQRANIVLDMLEKSELKIINSQQHPLRAKIFKAMPEIYSSAKVTLDISHFTDVQGYTSNRYFIIPAFYGLPLTKRFPGCEELYPSDVRVYWDTTEEALELKDYYINNPKEREKKVEQIHKWSFNHTYDKRWKTMFEKL